MACDANASEMAKQKAKNVMVEFTAVQNSITELLGKEREGWFREVYGIKHIIIDASVKGCMLYACGIVGEGLSGHGKVGSECRILMEKNVVVLPV